MESKILSNQDEYETWSSCSWGKDLKPDPEAGAKPREYGWRMEPTEVQMVMC